MTTDTTEQTTDVDLRGHQWWLRNAADHRASAKRQYEEARLCATWAKDTKDPLWANIYLIWRDRHRSMARWHQQMARGSIQHVKKLWPEAVSLDS